MNSSIFTWLVYAVWIAIIVYLTIRAIGIKADARGHWTQRFGLLFLIIVAFLLPHLSIFRFVNFAPVSLTLNLVGIIILAIGTWFFIWSREVLGKNWSQIVSAKKDHELIIAGPYAIVRNPMYTGGLVMVIGSAIVAGGPFVFLFVLLVVLFVWRINAEDKLMEQQFPQQYPEYKKRTKALIPFIW